MPPEPQPETSQETDTPISPQPSPASSAEATDGQGSATADTAESPIETAKPTEATPPLAAPAQDIQSETAQIPVIEPFTRKTLLVKAREMIQFRKRKKLEKIVEYLNMKGKVTNDEVEKLLHVSDATATRYLEQLEKEGKVKQVGRTGQSVSYSRI